MIVPPSDPAIPFEYSCVYWILITYQKGILDHWGEHEVSWIYCFGKGGGYIQVVIQLYKNDFFTKCYGENNKWYYQIISV